MKATGDGFTGAKTIREKTVAVASMIPTTASAGTSPSVPSACLGLSRPLISAWTAGAGAGAITTGAQFEQRWRAARAYSAE